ncbi:acetyl-CoA carboxylase biotin carboxylase subunit family protein [Streptomyces sp. NPDC057521]|uniref:ATP-grasp domain-containing protein n=1 Tax=Streptomyces sp. NPDC057521 TaxID=3346156 RepID=UPI003696A461
MSRKPVLVINAAKHGFMFEEGRTLLPFDSVEPYLLTHPYGGADQLDPQQYPHVAVCNFHKNEEILAAARWMISEYGITAIVAPHEKYLVLAAQLRTEFGLPGLQYESAVLFRDKIKMKQAVQAAGLRIPAFWSLDRVEDLDALDWSRGSKIIKSRFGVGGSDVYHVDTLEAAREAWQTAGPDAGQFEVEEFIHGTMYHVDAIVSQGEVVFTSASRYLAKPGDFTPGGIFGSVNIRSGDLFERICDFNSRAVTALGMEGGVTHLELFHTPEDELVFCEVAARPGGAGIDRAIDQCFGVNIVEAAVRLEAGLQMPIPSHAADRVKGPVWGFIGIYPDGPEPGPAIELEQRSSMGIAEYLPGGAKNAPRHCSDFTHRYIVGAADETAFDERYRALAEASGAHF